MVEGLDISADHMVSPEDDTHSLIRETFRGSTVFITGATGFLGKLTLEKLLRSCADVAKIYIIVREKKGKDVETRKKEMFENEVFDPLRRRSSKFADKVEIITGDLTLPDLGMRQSDIGKIISEVNFIFHIAATVRFDEKIRTAVSINITATRDLLRMAKEMKQLRAFVHVSTAYSNCPRKDIEEKLYEPPIAPEKLIDVVNALDDDTLASITPTLIGNWPNTYVFTKALAEYVVKTEGKGLPVAMVRPSIVTSTYKEPLAGWIDNLYGATGVIMGAAVGLIRSLNGSPNKLADIVPADHVINCIISSAWDLAANKDIKGPVVVNGPKEKLENEEENVRIYNYVSAPEKPITWGEFMQLTYEHAMIIPSEMCVWYYFFFLTPNPYVHMILVFLLHTIPAHVVDFGAKLIGRKPRLVKGYEKINKFLVVLTYFASSEWDFCNKNTQQLWKKLNSADQKIFSFSMSNLNWDEYFDTYLKGVRVYLLKDPMDTLEKGKSWYRKLIILHYLTLAVVSLLFLKLAHLLCNFCFSAILA